MRCGGVWQEVQFCGISPFMPMWDTALPGLRRIGAIRGSWWRGTAEEDGTISGAILLRAVRITGFSAFAGHGSPLPSMPVTWNTPELIMRWTFWTAETSWFIIWKVNAIPPICWSGTQTILRCSLRRGRFNISRRFLYHIENCTNFTLSLLYDYRINCSGHGPEYFSGTWFDPCEWHMLTETAPNGDVITTLPCERPCLYKRGNYRGCNEAEE